MNKLPAILLMILVFTLPLANSAEAAFNLSSFFGGGSQTTKTTAQQKSTTTTSGTVIGDINKSTGQEDPFVHFENKDEDTVDNDLIIEVTGYQPTIIDANLLENQNVYVTALLSAIPINPSISIPKIRDITVRKTNITVLPKTKSATVKVAGVQYVKPKDVELSFANLGYLVITLEKIPKEADVPDSVTIGIQAEIHLDVYSSVGARATEDVLIAESFDDWKENKEQHKSFAGYIQATAITDDTAVFTVYKDDLTPIAKDIRIKKGTSSGSINPQETFYKTPGEVLLNKYKIQVNDIRKEGDTVRMFIERDGIAETRALQQGQALYPGSVWKVASITKGIPTPTTKTTAKKTTTKTPACTWSKGKSGFVSTTSTTWNYRLVTENCREKTVTLTFKTKDTTQTIVRRIDLDQQEIVTSFKNPPIKSEDIKVTFKAPATTTTNQQETTIESSCFINEKLSKFIDLGAGNNNYRLVTKNCIGKTIRTTFSKGGTILEKKDLVITKDTEEFSITINQQINQFSIKVAYTVIKSTTPQQTSTTGTTTLTETYTTPEGITFILPVGTILPPGSSIGGTTFTGNPLLTPFEVLPGGTIPAGTILPAGTVLPAGIQQPGTNQNKVTIIIEDHLKRQRSFTLDLQQKCNLGTSRTKIVPELGKQITVTATLAPPSFIPGEDIKKNFDQALSNYKEVQRLTENTPNNELARQAQERIVSIYETLSTNNLEGGIFDHLDELDELEASTTDETQKRVLQIKRNVYTVIKQQCVGKPELIDDNGILLSVVPYSYQPRHDEEAIATLKYSATNQLQKVKTGDYLTTPDGKLWTIKQINTNNITLERLNQETTQYDYQDITQQQGYCIQNAINQQQKDCITLVNIEAGKEVYITIQPDTDKAKTVSQFNVHLNIDKRAFNLPLFSKNIDEEINNTEKLLEKLTKIVDNAKKLHAFWTKFCFITFGVLWTTSFLENTLGGSKENIARGKITDQWHQKYQDQAGKPNGIKDYDKFIFANQEAYENDLEKATKIIDDINNDRYTNALPKGLTEEQRKSDEAKDYYFYKKMAEDQKNEETRQLFAHKSAELRRDIANTQLANELEEKNYEKLTPEVKESFKIHVATHATYYKIPSGTIIDDTYLKNKWVGLQGAKSPAEGDQTMLRAFQEDYRQKILNEKLETGLREDLTNIGFDAAEVDKSVARELQLLGYKPTAKTTNIRYVDTRDIRNEANDPTKRYYQDPDGTRYYLQPPAGVTPTPPVTTPAVGTAPTAPGVKPPTTNQLQKFFDKYGNATDIQYKIVDPNDAKTIAERLQAEHQPRVALIPEGKNKGRVQSMTINGKLYVENEYNEVGIITGQRVYERVVENDALGTTYANYIGTVPEAQKYYQEKGKTDQEAKIIAQQLDDSKSCIGQINKNLAGKTLKQGEAVRTGCKLGNYVVQNTAQKLGSSCTDFMSPDNCKMLFNACDPVICPASRCNLGGAWNVPDVVQSGLVGSTFLCINNWVVINPSQGDIYTLPVCLTGIIAGLENIQTILESYKQCLITAKVDGRSVGFCDSLRNFYLCDSLWREATALLDMENGLLGAITEQVLGANGGGEYASFKASFDKSTESLSYFTKDYAKQVFAGYNGASLDELGTEICKAAIYGKAPDVGQFIDEISKPESPPQYSAYYNEKYYSDIKGYKENMYTYGYHIFAGSRSAMTYSVYMKAVDAAGTTIINYPAISIARGKTLQAGQFATESKPLIAPEGYNQICIETRSERYGMNTKCGFGKVTTDFGVNYLVDEYVTKTAETRNIKTADQCVPETRGSATNQGVLAGTASHGLAAPLGGMVGGAVGGLTGGTLGGGFQETGIIRQCSTYNPGVGTAEDNWKVVGTCGKDDKGRELGTCWLYTANLKQLVQNQNNVQEIEATIVNLTEEQRVDRAQQLGLIIMDPAEAKQQLDSIQATLQMYNNYFTNQFEQATFDKAVEDIKVILDPYLKTILTQNFNVEQDLRARYTLGLAYEQLARLHLWKQKFTQLQQPTTITPAPQGTPTTTQTTPNPIITDLVLKLNRNTVFTVRGGSYIITVKESLQEKISIAITGVSQPIILLKNQPTAIDIDNSLTQDIKLTYQGLNNDLDILLSVEELPQKTVTTPAPATTAPGTTTNQPISTNTCILNKQRTGISIASNALLLYPPTKEVETAYYHLTTTGCINKEATITLETPQDKIEKSFVIQKNAEVITLPLNTKIAAQNLKDKVQLTLDTQETYQPIKTYTLAADESTAFTLLEEQHTLGVEQATEQETTVTIASTPQTLTIKKGETKTVDIDEYNSNDLSITYQGLNEQQKALLRIEELPQPDNIMHIFTLKKSGNDLAYRNALEKYEKENTAKKPLVKILDIPISDEAEQPTTQKIIIDTPAVKASETTIQQTATALETTTATAKKDLEEEAITCTTEPITEEPTEEKSEDIQKLETIQQHINEVKTLSTKLSKELIGMNGLFTTLKEIAQNTPQGTIQLPGTYTVPVYQGLPSNLPGTYYTKIIDGKEYITDYNLPGLEIRPLAYSNYVLLFRLDMRTNNPNERSLPLDTIIKKVKQQPQLTITGRPPSIAAKNLRTFNEAQQLYTSMQQSYDRLTTLLYSSEGGLSYGDLAFMQNNCELIHLSKEEANHYYDDLASIGGEIESYRKGLASIQQQLDTYAIHGIPQLP